LYLIVNSMFALSSERIVFACIWVPISFFMLNVMHVCLFYTLPYCICFTAVSASDCCVKKDVYLCTSECYFECFFEFVGCCWLKFSQSEIIWRFFSILSVFLRWRLNHSSELLRRYCDFYRCRNWIVRQMQWFAEQIEKKNIHFHQKWKKLFGWRWMYIIVQYTSYFPTSSLCEMRSIVLTYILLPKVATWTTHNECKETSRWDVGLRCLLSFSKNMTYQNIKNKNKCALYKNIPFLKLWPFITKWNLFSSFTKWNSNHLKKQQRPFITTDRWS
jgi:hypothetical protein